MPPKGAILFSSECAPYTWEPNGKGGQWELFDEDARFCIEIQEFEPTATEGDDSERFWVIICEIDPDTGTPKPVASIPIDLGVVNPRFYAERSSAVISITPRVDDQPTAVYLITFPSQDAASRFENQFCLAVQTAEAMPDAERDTLRALVAPSSGPAASSDMDDAEFAKLYAEACAAEPAAEAAVIAALPAAAAASIPSQRPMDVDVMALGGACLRPIPMGEVGSIAYLSPSDRAVTVSGASVAVAAHRPRDVGSILDVPVVQTMDFAPHGGLFRLADGDALAALCPQGLLSKAGVHGRGMIGMYDIESGKVVQYLEGLHGDGVTGEDGAAIADVATAYEGGGEVPIVAVGRGWINGFDPRVRGKGGEVVVGATRMNMEFRSQHTFVCCALTADGHVVAGTTKGIVVFHRGVPGVGKVPKTAMTALKLFNNVPIKGLDVTPDGKWVLATTRLAVVLIKCFDLEGAASRDATCFTSRTKADILARRGRLWTLTLRPEDFVHTSGRPFERARFAAEAAGGERVLQTAAAAADDAHPDRRPAAPQRALPHGWPADIAVPVGDCVVQWAVGDVLYGGMAGLYRYQVMRVGGVDRDAPATGGLKAAAFARGRNGESALMVAGDGVLGAVPRHAASRRDVYGDRDPMQWPR